MINKTYRLIEKKQKYIKSNKETINKLYDFYEYLKSKEEKTKFENSLMIIMKSVVLNSYSEQRVTKKELNKLKSQLDHLKNEAKRVFKRNNVIEFRDMKVNNADESKYGKNAMQKRLSMYDDKQSFVYDELLRINDMRKSAETPYDKKVVRREESYLHSIINRESIDVSDLRKVI